MLENPTLVLGTLLLFNTIKLFHACLLSYNVIMVYPRKHDGRYSLCRSEMIYFSENVQSLLYYYILFAGNLVLSYNSSTTQCVQNTIWWDDMRNRTNIIFYYWIKPKPEIAIMIYRVPYIIYNVRDVDGPFVLSFSDWRGISYNNTMYKLIFFF